MGYSAYKEAVGLAELGHVITVVHGNADVDHYRDPRITLVRVRMPRFPIVDFAIQRFNLWAIFRFHLDPGTFDVVYIQSLEFGLLDLSRIKVPIFYYARSTMRGMQRALRNEGEKKSLFAKIIQMVLVGLEQRCMRYSKITFVKSRQMASEVSDLYGQPANKIAVITGGIDEKDFQREPVSAVVAFKEKYEIPMDVPVVLYAGRIVPQKGLLCLIEASLKLLREKTFVVVIAGVGVSASYYAKVKCQVEDSTYKKSFYFLGHIDQREMSLVLNAADCLVTPSVYEPFGMVNLQAAFLNKIIITTDITGSADLLVNYKKMKIVHAGSSTAIESAMREVLSWKNQSDQALFDFRVHSWLKVAEQLTYYFSTTN